VNRLKTEREERKEERKIKRGKKRERDHFQSVVEFVCVVCVGQYWRFFCVVLRVSVKIACMLKTRQLKPHIAFLASKTTVRHQGVSSKKKKKKKTKIRIAGTTQTTRCSSFFDDEEESTSPLVPTTKNTPFVEKTTPKTASILTTTTKMMQFCDIGANVVSATGDTQFDGFYHHGSKRYHESDVVDVLERAHKVGVREILATSGTLDEAKATARQCRTWNTDGGGEKNAALPKMYGTVGVHPTRAGEFNDSTKCESPEAYVDALKTVVRENADVVAAIGECGLDYDRLHFCDKETQKKYFQLQLEELAGEFELPLFLHSRNSREDFYEILKRNARHLRKGAVVHSFTGSKEEFEELLALHDKVYIGVNGCSLKTEENVEVVKSIPLDRMLLETDAPWCGVKQTHFGTKYVPEDTDRIRAVFGPPLKPKKWHKGALIKDRCEPCHIVTVCQIVAGCKGTTCEDVAAACYRNSRALFFPHKDFGE